VVFSLAPVSWSHVGSALSEDLTGGVGAQVPPGEVPTGGTADVGGAGEEPVQVGTPEGVVTTHGAESTPPPRESDS